MVPDPGAQAGLPGWTVNQTLTAAPADDALAVHVCLQKTGDSWSSQPMSCSDLRQAGAEAVILDFGARRITLDAKIPSKLSKGAQGRIGAGPAATSWECFYGAGGTSERSLDSYNVCASDFASSVNMVGTVAGSAVNAVFGTARSVVEVNAGRVFTAVAASHAIEVAHQNVDYHIEELLRGAASTEMFDRQVAKYIAFLSPEVRDGQIPEIRKQVEARQLAVYRKDFETARTAGELRAFATRYAGTDPDGLVAIATSRAGEIEDRNRAAAAETEKRRQVAAAADASQKHSQAVAFRKTVQVGSDTHCGLVLAVKGPIAEVQAPIGQVWMKISQLYPAGLARCDFYNGSYQEPNLSY